MGNRIVVESIHLFNLRTVYKNDCFVSIVLARALSFPGALSASKRRQRVRWDPLECASQKSA